LVAQKDIWNTFKEIAGENTSNKLNLMISSSISEMITAEKYKN
jgi:hypothetical protein